MFSKDSRPSLSPRPEDRAAAPHAAGAPPSIISADLKIVGDLMGGGDLQIDGTIEGNVSTQRLTIGEGAVVHGALVAHSVRVYGRVSGEIEADTVVLAKTARVEGEVTQRTISMEPGATFEGRLSRLKEAPEATSSARERVGPAGAAPQNSAEPGPASRSLGRQGA